MEHCVNCNKEYDPYPFEGPICRDCEKVENKKQTARLKGFVSTVLGGTMRKWKGNVPMEFRDYMQQLKDNAIRMNAKHVSISFTDCKDLEGWNVHLSISAPDFTDEDTDASKQSVNHES